MQINWNLNSLKQEFAKTYNGNAHIQEVIPEKYTDQIPIENSHLNELHKFAENNPIYHNSFSQKINGISCIVYEGDINEYWLSSIKHGSSCQPFYPTWIVSAYCLSKLANSLNFDQIIDIGSGDGRIAFCGKIFGMSSHSIEIDDSLVELQKLISDSTSTDFDPICFDALEFNYDDLQLTKPLFFIGGLPQMGGDMLAVSIIEKLQANSSLKTNSGIVLAGTNSKRKLSSPIKNGGWNNLIEKYCLRVVSTVSLPTVWTFDQKDDTPYVFTTFTLH